MEYPKNKMSTVSFEKILDDLKHNTILNPFHYKFDLKYTENLLNEINNNKNSIDKNNEYIVSILKSLKSFNDIYTRLIKDIDECLRCLLLDKSELESILTAYANYIFIYMTKELIPKQAVLNNQLIREKANELALNCELICSVNNILFSYFNYFYSQNIIKVNKLDKKSKYDLISILNFTSHVIVGLKEAYEYILYNKYFVYVKDEDDKKIIKCEPSDLNLIKTMCINGLRQSNLTIETSLYLNGTELFKDYINNFKKNLKKKQIKTISINNTVVDFNIAKSKKVKTNEYEEYLFKIFPFFDYIMNDQTSTLITDFEILYSQMLKLFNAVKNSDYKKTSEIEKFPAKILKRKLIEYLKNTTNISSDKVIKFVKLNTNNGAAIDLFNKPFIEEDGYLYFHLLNTVDNSPVSLIYRWLEEFGFKTNELGAIFENYTKTNLDRILNDKNINYKIIETKNFQLKNGKSEEIDLIIVFDKIVLLGEMKSIKFPVGERETDNARKRIYDGIDQIIRKKQFITDNETELDIYTGDISNKKIIPFVLTNYPVLTGCNYKNIPIIDIKAFFNYLSKGYLEIGSVSNKKLEKHTTIYYYNTKEEFEDNIENYLLNPIPVTSYFDKLITFEKPIFNEKVSELYNLQLIIKKIQLDENIILNSG